MTARRLRIYGEIIFSCVGMTLLAAFFMAVVVGAGMRDQGGNVFYIMAVYNLVVGLMVLAVTPFGIYQSLVAVIFSMNCTRKRLFLSFQIIKVLNVTLITAVCGILMLLQNTFGEGRKEWILFGAGFFILLFIASLGNFMGVLYSRYGGIIVVLCMLLSMLSGGVIGFITSAGFKSGIEKVIEGIFFGNKSLWLVCAAATAGIAVLLDAAVSWAVFRRYEVRR